MQINATQIRTGMVLVLDNELYRVTWTMHRTPGKGNACMQTKLKHIINGKNMEKRFLSSERVEKASLDGRDMQFLYAEGDSLNFMDNENFEQTVINGDLVGDGVKFLVEGASYPVTFFEGTPVGVSLPLTITLKVTMAPPEIKKATATNSMRPVELENGMSVNAPGFIKEGDMVKISTDTCEYVERAND